nr:8700_t:CDS:10 [Entrophospora candida]
MTKIKDTLRSISSNSSNTDLQTLIDLIEKFTTARDGPGDPEKIDEVSTKALHIHQILETPLLDSLLTSLQLDTSTTVISLSLTTLIMLLPHICTSVINYLPQLYIIFIRILCWDKRSSFKNTPTGQPNFRHLFTFLYGMFPCNTVQFLKDPTGWVKKMNHVPIVEGIDDDVIRARSLPLLQRHTVHPNLISSDCEKELSDTSRWMKLEPADFIVESIGFDIDNSSKKYADQIENITKKILQESNNSVTGKPNEMRRRPSHTISVKEIMEVHEALKSGVDIVLNFELYLKQQHLQHIGRLHRDHILDNMAEAERQNLYNTCRTLKSQLKRVQAAFDRQRTETANLKKTKVQWENELNTKLKNYREQEKELKLQMDKTLQELNEAKLTISKQSRRIEEIEAKNFLVESKLKLIEPELVKLTEYQEIIDQLKKQLVLWELDTKKFERQRKDLEILVMEWHKMEMILESKDQEIEQLKNLVSDQSEMINELRIKCKKNVKDSQNNQKTAFEKQFEEYKKLETNYDQLKKSNEELKSEVLELLAKIESLTPREPISISLL